MKKRLTHFYIAWQAFNDYLYREWIMRVPFYLFRLFFIKKTLAKLGQNCFIAMEIETRYGKNISIGDNCIINKKVLLDGRGGRLTLENNVDVAQEVNIWTLSHDPQHDYHATKGADVYIEEYVWIASRVTILPGVRIGRGAVVATGSVVTKNVPPMTIVAGVPAKVVGQRTSRLQYTLNHQPWFR